MTLTWYIPSVLGEENFSAGNRHKQNIWFCKEIREDNFRFWWRRVHEDASEGMYMSKIEIFFFTARILQNQRMLCLDYMCPTKTSKSPHAFGMCSIRTDLLKQENEKIDSL
jgi:hypothetical protein